MTTTHLLAKFKLLSRQYFFRRNRSIIKKKIILRFIPMNNNSTVISIIPFPTHKSLRKIHILIIIIILILILCPSFHLNMFHFHLKIHFIPEKILTTIPTITTANLIWFLELLELVVIIFDNLFPLSHSFLQFHHGS